MKKKFEPIENPKNLVFLKIMEDCCISDMEKRIQEYEKDSGDRVDSFDISFNRIPHSGVVDKINITAKITIGEWTHTFKNRRF